MLAAAPAASEAGPLPEWQFGEYPYRMILALPPEVENSAIVRLPRPARMPVTPDGFVMVDSARIGLPTRVAYVDPDEVTLQFVLFTNTLKQPFYLYFGATGTPLSVQSAEPDPEPLLAVVRQASGIAIPETVERLRYMTRSLKFQAPVLSIGSFDETPLLSAELKADRGRRRSWRGIGRGINMGALRTYLACPEDGVYRFGVDCRDAASVSIDGREVASWLGTHNPGEWRMGQPLALRSGVHRLEVSMLFGGTSCTVRVGWVLPRARDIRPIEGTDMVGSCEALETRVERVDRILQPGFTFTTAAPYRFREFPYVFTPVAFANTTADWVTSDFTARWKFGDGRQAEGLAVSRVYSSPDEFKATLEVRDDLGFVASCSRVVDCRAGEPEEYAVSFDLRDVPPACFSRDRLAPCLYAVNSGMPALPFDIRFRVKQRSGVEVERLETIRSTSAPLRVPAGEWSAGDLAELSWEAQHEGVPLAQGTVRFLRRPFDAAPSRVSGQALYDRTGNRLVLVADDGGTAGRTSRPPAAGGKRVDRTVVCVDDMLAAGALHDAPVGESFHVILRRLLTGTAHALRYESLPAWEQSENASGPARKFVDVPAAIGTNAAVAVLSIGLTDMLNGQGTDAFERQAAALTDLLAARVPRIVWVTPPPYPSDQDRVRGFAAAIRRVAVARGAAVADLFTRFHCAEGKRSDFFTSNELVLSDRGQRMAAQEIARALLEAEK